ncbi:guanitoxin biosynthesis L-enduracididine beta-hydroxylase GntD [Micromonospora chersina]|uniref:guanitoxin biosynthesis L-enduracididine beta-hydroxylase GntD n=1 Tax=Micromonospora chersina TaxID=47854 RepID=UPI003716852E
MYKLDLSAEEVHDVTRLLKRIDDEFTALDTEEALKLATVYAHDLPQRVRARLNEFRLGELDGVLVVSGWPVDQERVGPTPKHWRERPEPTTSRREELLLLMLGSLLGDPFAWATQQDGRLIHDVLPIAGHENEQLGSSSAALLTWHTEDAFHPLRGDFLMLGCLRNPYGAQTTVGYVDSLDLPESVREVLFEPRFSIRPDESHLAKNNSDADNEAFTDIEEMDRAPEPIAVLFGDRNAPYIRADPYFMDVAEGDDQARSALDAFSKAMDDLMFDVALQDGDFIIIDNYRVVHGRKPFKARHDGTDRWLKRINITADLRKSRASRPGRADRTIH